jgi:hypothetical protein
MVLGPRFLIEAGFIIAAAVVAGIERVGTWSIIAIVAAAWLVVAIVELAMWVRRPTVKRPVREQAAERPVEAWSPPAVAVAPEPAERPVQAQHPRIVAVPPAPEPESEPEPEPEPGVAYLPVSAEPREWNLWELERVARDHVSDDAARNEELAYLLVYLREFAGPDGDLPADFDGLVRDAFGELVRVAT